jgi:acetyl-CoA acetyltransferase
MLQTAENVAKECSITREEQEELVLLRSAQYQKALEDDRAFQKRYMVLPIEVKDGSGRKVLKTVEGDEGVFPTTPEGLRKLRPVLEGGTVTFGAQTYPADGSAALLVTTGDKARELSRDPGITIRILSFGQARAKKGHMAMAVAPAAKLALQRAGISTDDLAATKTHNPFAVNDIHFARELGLSHDAFNAYGSPLVYGHPQGPTGLRAMIELIEELVLAGGGNGLFSGCAAGDSAMAVTFRVDAG